MRILVLGSGGREHALYLKLAESQMVSEIYFAPGNGGVPQERCFALDIMDFEAVERLVLEKSIDLLVVGPEAPLAGGIKDFFHNRHPGIKVFGPDGHSAKLEASKVFSWEFMDRKGIPTAKSAVGHNLEESLAILQEHSLPVVIKADGLAAGKGVSIHNDRASAEAVLHDIFEKDLFGEAGSKVLFQEFMEGKEASLFALCNGKDAIYLPTACDYKRANDDGEGPNTGGMGSYSPGEILTADHIDFIHTHIVQKVLDEFHYTGILYVGLMVHGDSVSVVEFNCRLGDPETQCVLPRIETDLLPYLLWSCGAKSGVFKIKEQGHYLLPSKPGYAMNVVLAASGYPGSYEKSIPLPLPEKLPEGVHIVHAGTAQKDGSLVSTGGRILSVVGYDQKASGAREKVYSFIEELKKSLDFGRLHYRKDIGL